MHIVADAVVSLMFIIMGYIGIYCYINKIRLNKLNGDILKLSKNKILYLTGGVIAALLLITLFEKLYAISLIKQLKLLILIFIIFPCAAADYREHKIPNPFILAALVIRVIIFIFEFVLSASAAISAGIDGIAGAVIIAGFFLLMLLLFKNSIGMGDVKLFFVMGLYQGLWGAVNSVFFSLIASFAASIFFLVSRKKNKKDSIAFAPCILVGAITAMALSGM